MANCHSERSQAHQLERLISKTQHHQPVLASESAPPRHQPFEGRKDSGERIRAEQRLPFRTQWIEALQTVVHDEGEILGGSQSTGAFLVARCYLQALKILSSSALTSADRPS